jgi:hypothetical protein
MKNCGGIAYSLPPASSQMFRQRLTSSSRAGNQIACEDDRIRRTTSRSHEQRKRFKMTVFTVPSSRTQQSWEFEAPIPCGLVVGVDGSPESVAALNTAAFIARARRCPLQS